MVSERRFFLGLAGLMLLLCLLYVGGEFLLYRWSCERQGGVYVTVNWVSTCKQ